MAASRYFYSDRIIASKKHHIINNAIQTNAYVYNEKVRDEIRNTYGLDDRYVLGHVGRFQYQKNHEFLIDVFNEYLKMDNQAVLMLVGQGENQENIKKKVIDLGIERMYYLLGVRSECQFSFSGHGYICLPSRI